MVSLRNGGEAAVSFIEYTQNFEIIKWIKSKQNRHMLCWKRLAAEVLITNSDIEHLKQNKMTITFDFKSTPTKHVLFSNIID